MSDYPFAHLHLHTGYSLLDGACKIDEVMQAARLHDMKAIAITDHNVMYGAPKFCEAAHREGIKPIIGCELNITDRSMTEDRSIQDDIRKIVLLVKNSKGYRNLVALVSKAHMESRRPAPCIDLDLLARHTDGLIGLSAWREGLIAARLDDGGEDAAAEMATTLSDIFGKDNFYVEIQNHGLKDDEYLIPQTVGLAYRCDIPVVATNNVHYVCREHALARLILYHRKVDNDQPILDMLLKGGTDPFHTDQFYLKSGAEMVTLFGCVPVQNTLRIAERCEGNVLESHGFHFPTFPVPGNVTASQYLRRLVMDGLNSRYGFDTLHPTDKTEKNALDRALYELEVIENTGFSNYFLVVWDYVRFAREKDIPMGPGAWGASGSIVAYALGITEIDPLRYDLVFECFLNPAFIHPPEITMDFCMNRRGEVLDYVKQKYGHDRVAHISTFGSFTMRTAAMKAMRAAEMSNCFSELLADLISPAAAWPPPDAETSIANHLFMLAHKIKRVADYKRMLEGLPIGVWHNEAGLVISDEAITDIVPLWRTREGNVAAQYDNETLGKLGFIKLYFLQNKTLTENREAVRLIEEKHKRQVSLAHIPDDDSTTFNLINGGDTSDVFFMGSRQMRDAIKRSVVRSIDDLAVLIALLTRPNQMEEYLRRRTGITPVWREHPLLTPILRETCGLIVYDEQFDRVLVALAGEPIGDVGYSLGEADRVRRTLEKKRVNDVVEQMRRFVDGCVRTGAMSPDEAMDYFQTLLDAAERCYSKAHVVAYSTLAYQCAYLKANFPEEYREAREVGQGC